MKSFSMEKEKYLYPPELSSWVRISQSPITERFAGYDLLITAQIAPLIVGSPCREIRHYWWLPHWYRSVTM